MSDIKKYFEKGQPFKFLAPSTAVSVKSEIESIDYLRARVQEKERFFPNVDFSEPASFAKYGSAEEYYDNSFKYIYNTYPYDGSLYEKTLWRLSASYLDLYLFENEYPRTNGHITLNKSGYSRNAFYNPDVSIYGATNVKLINEPPDASKEYIIISGGPHIDNDVSFFHPDSKTNIYDVKTNRTNNLHVSGVAGNTIEFWAKFGGPSDGHVNLGQRQIIFDLWNNLTSSHTSYGRVTLALNRSTTTGPADKTLTLTLRSGSLSTGNDANGCADAIIYSEQHSSAPGALYDEKWHHYAIAVQNNGTQLQSKVYIDGRLRNTVTTGSAINHITGALQAHIGALMTSSYLAIGPGQDPQKYAGKGWGLLSASLDEFRFWKTARNAKQIGRYWNTHVGGGTNTDDSNTDLGVYYKFNEGIVDKIVTDSVVLDYSGRISNGTWHGYVSGSRSTGSAMVLSNTVPREFKDPIIYKDHPDVDSLITAKAAIGKEYDERNNASIYNTFPDWIRADDEEGDRKTLKYLTQIMSSFFDTLHLEIESLPVLKEKAYATSSLQTHSFYDSAIKSTGFVAPEIFADASLIEKFDKRDEERYFEKDLDEIKNLIYQNIYNNLDYIYKTKGTEKSFRNLLHCFGIDENVVKINFYASNTDYTFEDNFETNVVKRKYIDFNTVKNRGATIVQNIIPSASNAIAASAFISGTDYNVNDGTGRRSLLTDHGHAFTLEAEAVLTNSPSYRSTQYIEYPFLTSSIVGIRTCTPTGNPTYSDNVLDLALYAVREFDKKENIPSAYFQLSGTLGTSSVNIISSFSSSLGNVRYDYDAYNDSKWNFAIRVSPSTYGAQQTSYGFAGAVSGSETESINPSASLLVELYGVRTSQDIILNEFSASQHVYRHPALSTAGRDPMRIYAGARRVNFVDSVVQAYSDAKIGSVRYWFDYLDNDTIKSHAKDVRNYGRKNPYRSAYLFQNTISGAVPPESGEIYNNPYVPEIATLALHWEFENITGSNISGEFNIYDQSSPLYVTGSQNFDRTGDRLAGSDSMTFPESLSDKDNRYTGQLSRILSRRHDGQGIGFVTSSANVIDTRYIPNASRHLPEMSIGSDMIVIRNEDDELFTRDMRPQNHFILIEKSPSQTISAEMLKMFSTIKGFNSLVGDPVNKYRKSYKPLTKLRKLFFEKVENDPDVEKYFDYYRWIDSSIAAMLSKLLPASAIHNENVYNVIESHILERNKYQHKFNHLKFPKREYEVTITSNNQFDSYSQVSSPPGGGKASNEVDGTTAQQKEEKNPEWWSSRAEKTNPIIVDERSEDRKKIFEDVRKTNKEEKSKIYRAFDGAIKKNAPASTRRTTFKRPLKAGANDAHSTENNNDWIIEFGTKIAPPLSQLEYMNRIKRFGGDVAVLTLPDSSLRLFKAEENQSIRQTSRRNEIPVAIDKYKFIDSVKVELQDRAGTTIYLDGIPPANTSHAGKAPYADFLPFSFYSSSVDTNFRNEAGPIGKIQIANLHIDAYDSQVSMQGPFTNTHVGGEQHRHVPLNIVRDENANNTNKLDNEFTRPEAYRIHNISSNEYKIYSPDNDNTDFPRASYLRVDTSKRPYNVRHIANVTSSNVRLQPGGTRNYNPQDTIIAGNYDFNYQYALVAGKSMRNDLMWRKHTVDDVVSTASFWIDGMPHYNHLERTASGGGLSDVIFTTRFSRMGAETISNWSLDPTLQYSVYNSLPYSNLTVRQPLNKAFLSSHMTKLGYANLPEKYSGKATAADMVVELNSTASFHRVHRNTKYRYTASADGAVAIEKYYDNAFISKVIPSSERQYTWITKSLLHHDIGASAPLKFSNEMFRPADAASSSFETITFLSESEFGSVDNNTGRLFGRDVSGLTGPDDGYEWLATPFNNMITNIYEPITASTNTLGYVSARPFKHVTADSHGISDYVNPGFGRGISTRTANTYARATGFGLGNVSNGRAALLNAINLKRNGPYGWPTWKQIRAGEHPVARDMRLKNRIAVQNLPEVIKGPKDIISVPFNSAKFESFTEPPLANKYKPLEIVTENVFDTAQDKAGNRSNSEMAPAAAPPRTSRAISIVRNEKEQLLTRYLFTYSNNLASYANEDLRRKVYKNYNFVIDEFTKPQEFYENIYSSYGLPKDSNQVPRGAYLTEFNHGVYREVIWPREENTFLARTRERLYYSYPNWYSASSGPFACLPNFNTDAGDFGGEGGGSFTSAMSLNSKNPNALGCGMVSPTVLNQPQRYDRILRNNVNSQGFTIQTQSAWPLDGHILYNQNQISGYTDALPYLTGTSGCGELQNNYVTFWKDNQNINLPGNCESLSGALSNNHALHIKGVDESFVHLGRSFHFPRKNKTISAWINVDTAMMDGPGATNYGARRMPIWSMGTDGDSDSAVFFLTASANGTGSLGLGFAHKTTRLAASSPEPPMWIAATELPHHGLFKCQGSLSTGNTGSWHHVAVSFKYHQEPQNATASFYIDGVQHTASITNSTIFPTSPRATNSGATILNSNSKLGTASVGYASPSFGGESYIGWAKYGGLSTSGSDGYLEVGTQGSDPNCFRRGYAGLIDEVAIWAADLDKDAVNILYNDARPTNLGLGSAVSSSYLLSWWRLGDDPRDKIDTNLGFHPNNRIYDQISASAGATDAGGNIIFSADTVQFYRSHLDATVLSPTSSYNVENRPKIVTSLNGINIANSLPGFSKNAFCTPIPGALYTRRVPITSSANTNQVFYLGDAFWDAPSQANLLPWYDSYGKYSEEIKRYAKHFSIIPEFRISDHMEYFVKDKKGDFLADRKSLFIMSGAHPDVDDSSKKNFYRLYSHSDFLRFFDKVEKDHTEGTLIDIDSAGNVTGQKRASTTELTLRCRGIKKFLPYDGFYPAKRTLQIASQLSKSIGPNLDLRGNANTRGVTGSALRSFLAPLFAPGVLYNSIKAGVAVDFPIYTDFHHTVPISGSPYYVNAEDYDYRVPFEALYEPQKYLSYDTAGLMYDIEAHPSASADLIAKWNGIESNSLYRMMIHNFLAESNKFFLGSLTTLQSLPDNDANFCNWADENRKQKYAMDIVLRRAAEDKNVDNYKRASAFGPPSLSSYGLTMETGSLDGETPAEANVESVSVAGYDPYTPPYYGSNYLIKAGQGYLNRKENDESEILASQNIGRDRGAFARVTFDPSLVDNYQGADLTHDGRPTLSQILSASTIDYYAYSDQPNHPLPGVSSVSFSGSVNNKNIMHITASLNIKNLVYASENVGSADMRRPFRWVIGTKAEFPILKFPYDSTNITLPRESTNDSLSIGMWHQYGYPTENIREGVVLEVRDTVPDSNKITGSLAKLLGFPTVQRPIGKMRDSIVVKEAIVAVPFVEKNCEPHFFKLHDNKRVNRALVKSSLHLLNGGEGVIPEEIMPGRSIVDMVRKMRDYVFPPTFDFLTFNGAAGSREVEPIAMYIFEFKQELTREDLSNIWQNLPPAGVISRTRTGINQCFETEESEPITHKLTNNGNELLTRIEEDLQWMVFKVKQKAEKSYYSTLERAYGKKVAEQDYLADLEAQLSDEEATNPATLPNASGMPPMAGGFNTISTGGSTSGGATLNAGPMSSGGGPSGLSSGAGRAGERRQTELNISTGENFKAPYSYNWPYDFFSLVELAQVEAEIMIDTNVKPVATSVPGPGQLSAGPVGTTTPAAVPRTGQLSAGPMGQTGGGRG